MFGKKIKMLVGAIILFGCSVVNADPSVEEVKQHLPPEARIIEVLGTDWMKMWLVFELRGECFLMYNGSHRNSIAPVDCGKYGK